MRDKKFFGLLKELDGQPIESYQQIAGDYDFTRYVIKCHPFRVQGPEIQPLFSIRVPQTIAEIPEVLFESPIRRTALEDYLLRGFSAEVDQLASFDMHGMAKRNIVVSSPDQTITAKYDFGYGRVCRVARGDSIASSAGVSGWGFDVCGGWYSHAGRFFLMS